jgi:ribosomal-protein-alanine N-acetyltransferase
MPAWDIQPLVPATDLDQVLAIEQDSFTNPWTEGMYRAELKNEGVCFFFVAKDQDRRVVGFCAFWHIVDEVHINNLAVAPGLRRQGIGSALLERVLREGAAMHATRATLEVRASNVPARRLYEHFGFTVAGIRRAYYSHPTEGALVLWSENLGPSQS